MALVNRFARRFDALQSEQRHLERRLTQHVDASSRRHGETDRKLEQLEALTSARTQRLQALLNASPHRDAEQLTTPTPGGRPTLAGIDLELWVVCAAMLTVALYVFALHVWLARRLDERRPPSSAAGNAFACSPMHPYALTTSNRLVAYRSLSTRSIASESVL